MRRDAAVVLEIIGLLGAIVLALVMWTPAQSNRDDHLKALFDARYEAWQGRLSSREFLLRGDFLDAAVSCPEFRNLADLGPKVLGYLMDKLAEGHSPVLLLAVLNIVKLRGPAQPHELLAWWHEGEPGVRRRFDDLRQQWHLRKGGVETELWRVATLYHDPDHCLFTRRREMTDAGRAYQAIEDLGIAILPLLVEQFRQGDYEFVDMAYALTDNQPPLPREIPLTAERKATAFLAWWEENKQDWLIPWPEPRPEPAQ